MLSVAYADPPLFEAVMVWFVTPSGPISLISSHLDRVSVPKEGVGCVPFVWLPLPKGRGSMWHDSPLIHSKLRRLHCYGQNGDWKYGYLDSERRYASVI